MRQYTLFFLLILIGNTALSQEKFFREIDSLVVQADYKKALDLIIQTEKGKEGNFKIRLTQKKAELLIMTGNLDEAHYLLESVKGSADNFTEGNTLTNLGFLFLNQGRSEKALETLQAAQTKFQSSHAESLEMARCLAYLALVYTSTGKYNQAEEAELIALQIRQKLLGEGSEIVAASYNDLGLIYFSSDPDKALEYYEKALAVYSKIHKNDHPKIAIANTNIGVAYRALKLYGDAITNLEVARQIWQKLYPQGHPNLATSLVTLGKTYHQMRDGKTARKYFDQALAMYSSYYGRKHPDISSVLNDIGSLDREEGQYEKALEKFQTAIISNAPKFNEAQLDKNPEASDHYNGLVMLYSLGNKARTLESLYYGKTLKLQHLRMALNTLLSCDSLIDQIRHQSSDENDKLTLGSESSEVYEDGVRIALAISELTANSEKFKNITFYFAEKSKSAVLQESIADAQAKSFAGIPAELVEQEKSLKASLAYLSQKLAQKPEVSEEKYLRETIFTLNHEYNTLIKKLETDYPNYFNLKFNTYTAGVREVQKQLTSNQAVVSYFIGENDNKIYHFVVTNKKFKIKSVTIPNDFERIIKGFNNSLFYSDFETFKRTSRHLSKILLPNLPSSIDEITIIPSGRLSTVPFEALTTSNGASGFDNAPYWILKDAISYEFSASLFVQKNKTTDALREPKIFLCAPIEFPINENLPSLPATETEVNAISKLFNNKSQVITLANATETAIKSNQLSDFNYLHFATHGIVDEAEPALSRIFLNTNDHEDGNLYSGEIYNLKLNANLAVLSACQTGLGKFSRGEGVIGLSRALTYAGAKNIIVSFWSVADESTAQLMTNFYRIQLGRNSAGFTGAIQAAKMEMIKGKKFASPYYWAPFVLIGN